MATEVRVGGNYKVGPRIGHGSFGEIYRGMDVLTGIQVAIKVESLRKRNPHLLHESKLYRLLQGLRGVPHIFWYGIEGEFSVLVMDLLGPSIEDLFERAQQRFTMKTSIMLVHQIITRLELVHTQGIIHRDIKPHNFTIGRCEQESVEDNTKLIFIIDFGLSKKYKDSRHAHMPYRDGRNLTGTARYVSINTHLGIEPSRRDDLESSLYVLLYLLRGGLPWQGLRAATKKEKYEKIMERKIETSIELLCKDLPKEIGECLKYCRSLRFSEKPDYAYIKSKLSAILLRRNLSVDHIFDWHLPAFPSPVLPQNSGHSTALLMVRGETTTQVPVTPVPSFDGGEIPPRPSETPHQKHSKIQVETQQKGQDDHLDRTTNPPPRSFSASIQAKNQKTDHEIGHDEIDEQINNELHQDNKIVAEISQTLVNIQEVEENEADLPMLDEMTHQVDVPTVDVPTVDVPTVDVPTIDVPTIGIPTNVSACGEFKGPQLNQQTAGVTSHYLNYHDARQDRIIVNERSGNDKNERLLDQRPIGINRLTSIGGSNKGSRLSFMRSSEQRNPLKYNNATVQSQTSRENRFAVAPKSSLAWSAASAMVSYLGLRKRRSGRSTSKSRPPDSNIPRSPTGSSVAQDASLRCGEHKKASNSKLNGTVNGTMNGTMNGAVDGALHRALSGTGNVMDCRCHDKIMDGRYCRGRIFSEGLPTSQKYDSRIGGGGDVKECPEIKEGREVKEGREIKEGREVKECRELRGRESQQVLNHQILKDNECVEIPQNQNHFPISKNIDQSFLTVTPPPSHTSPNPMSQTPVSQTPVSQTPVSQTAVSHVSEGLSPNKNIRQRRRSSNGLFGSDNLGHEHILEVTEKQHSNTPPV